MGTVFVLIIISGGRDFVTVRQACTGCCFQRQGIYTTQVTFLFALSIASNPFILFPLHLGTKLQSMVFRLSLYCLATFWPPQVLLSA